MGSQRPTYIDIDGDESVLEPRYSSHSLLASQRGTNKTRRIETDSSGNLFVAGVVTSVPSGVQDVNVVDQGTGTWANGVEVSVSSSAVQVLAANANRKTAIVQNTGKANVRIGITGVTSTTGVRLVPGGALVLKKPNVETNAIFAVREGSVDSIVFTQETV